MQISQAGLSTGRRGERRDEPGLPRHDLQDHLRQIDAGQQRVDVAAQLDQARRLVERLEALDVQLPLGVEADRGVCLQARADGAVRAIEGPRVLGEQIIRGRGQRQGGQNSGLGACPRLAGEQLRARVAPPCRGVGVDLAPLEMAMKLRQHAEHVRVAVDRAVRGGRSAEHEALPRAMDKRPVDVSARQLAGAQQLSHALHLAQDRSGVGV